MSEPTNAGSAPHTAAPTLTFRGGGWVIALSGLLVLFVIVWGMLGPLLGRRPTGDGRTLESYQFDLSTLLIPRESLTPSGNPRGFLSSLDHPLHLRGAEMLVYNEQNRPKYVVTTDRVIGITVNGQFHAWPLSMMNAHEVVNDTVGGMPVVATYSPLCDAAVVFDRRVAGSTRQFEVSGLLVDSNLVFCDKSVEGSDQANHAASLFLQLESRAIAGPLAASGVTLQALPNVCITTWADWLAAHPDSTVTLRDPAMIRRMKEISYARYFLTPPLEYPAAPVPTPEELAASGLRLKSPMIALRLGSGWKVVAIEPLAALPGASTEGVALRVDGVDFLFHAAPGFGAGRLQRLDGQDLESLPCLYFALTAVRGVTERVAVPSLPTS